MKGKSIAAAVASLGMIASMAVAMPLGASAADKYTAVNGTTTTFDKYLVMDEGANVPNVSFEYTVEAGTAQEFKADDKTIAIYAGPTPEKIAFSGTDISDTTTTDSKFEISFAQGNDTTLYASKGANDYVKNLDAGEKYAKKTATLSFADVAFDEPGIYRYVITETAGTAQGITYDTDNTRILDVYVEDNTTDAGKNLKVTSYILHATDSTVTINDTTYGSDGQVISGGTTNTADGAETSDYKSQGFTNEYTSHDLTFSKEVTGNQGSKDKYFAFTVKIEDAVKGTVYNVSYADDNNANTTDGNADASISAKPNSATTITALNGDTAVTQPATLTVGDDGTVTQVFYLQHGQKIAIRGLADNTKYTITEDAEDYKSTAKNDLIAIAAKDAVGTEGNEGYQAAVPAKTFDDDTTGNITGDVYTGYTNDRSGTIPTGILLSIAAPAVVGVIVIGGIAYLLIKNKRRKAEEE